MTEKNAMNMLVKTLATLSREVTLFNDEGISVPGGIHKAIPALGREKEVEVHEGYTWLGVHMPGVAYVRAAGVDAAAADCARLAGALVEAMVAQAPANDRMDVVRATLREELSGPEMETLMQEHGIQTSMDRCALLFHGATMAMRELIPVGDDDMLVEMDRHAVVLLKSMDNIEGYEELTQLAEAMEQTIMSETGEQPVISIGEMKSNMQEMGASYRAAWRALEIGRMFHPEKSIYAFNRLVLERLLSEINRELGMRYHQMLFNRKTQRLFNEEMLHTIDMFFEKDLNLSDTARQLYIHRNTLVYRLDKIQRQTGLDLRRFEDAITFRMLLLLGKCGGDKPASVR